MAEGNPNHRSVYLVTYSKADEDVSRQSFADVVVGSFDHYHLAIKLDRQKRWLRIRNKLAQKHGINVKFSNGHLFYYDAWQYVTKEDSEFLESENHPGLAAGFVPRTHQSASASNAKRTTSTPLSASSQTPGQEKTL